MQLSVIICTHNPRRDYLDRTLNALRAQTLPKEQWELLLIDNASKEPLAGRWELSWHPHARQVLELQLGLTHARLRGIREAQTGILVFVDDDNVLFPDYLAESLNVSRNWPLLGAWGGQQFPEFEGAEPAESWKRDFWASILKRDVWSNNYDRATAPIGAGVCLRRRVALRYAELAATDPLRQSLGRKGSALNAAEDIDMVFVACDLGLGLGRFVGLKLDHLMPKGRVDDAYLLRLSEGFGYSQVILDALRGIKSSRLSRIDRLVNLYRRLWIPAMQRRMQMAYEAGCVRAIETLENSSRPLSP
jgi:glycosyltransferase involved in cell wall biosynthesis